MSGFIPVDLGVRASNPIVADGNCEVATQLEDLMAQGTYGAVNFLPLIGVPARHDPDGPSPFLEGFTNLEAALSLEAWASDPLTGHFAAGVFNEAGVAIDLQYQAIPSNLDFLAESPAYDQPVAFSRDGALMTCPTTETPWDNHMSEIQVPILSIVAAGGFGVNYNDLDYVGSTDKTELIIQLHPAEEVFLDYGHADPYNAENAPELVWQPMLSWIVGHVPREAQDVQLMIASR